MKLLIKHFLFVLIVICFLIFYYAVGITCPIRNILGIPCPTCGMSRSFFSLLRLDFRESLFYSPMTLPLLLAIFLAIHRKLFPKHKKLIDFIVISVAIITLLIYLFRLKYNLIP